MANKKLTPEQELEIIAMYPDDIPSKIQEHEIKLQMVKRHISSLIKEKNKLEKIIISNGKKGIRILTGDLSLSSTAEKYGVHASTISRLLAKHRGKILYPIDSDYKPTKEEKQIEDFEDY